MSLHAVDDYVDQLQVGQERILSFLLDPFVYTTPEQERRREEPLVRHEVEMEEPLGIIPFFVSPDVTDIEAMRQEIRSRHNEAVTLYATEYAGRLDEELDPPTECIFPEIYRLEAAHEEFRVLGFSRSMHDVACNLCDRRNGDDLNDLDAAKRVIVDGFTDDDQYILIDWGAAIISAAFPHGRDDTDEAKMMEHLANPDGTPVALILAWLHADPKECPFASASTPAKLRWISKYPEFCDDIVLHAKICEPMGRRLKNFLEAQVEMLPYSLRALHFRLSKIESAA